MDFAYLGLLALLIFGFGFVIFFHELGHFLAAKWAGVEVEQFAVGFGQALFSWRKGMGLRWGGSRKEFEQRLRDYLQANEQTIKNDPAFAEATSEKRRLDYAANKLGISDTEYRLNWIPLGGYVKMLGQDDLDPNAKSDAPHAYNNKSIGKRMVIVSAGVIMNIILAVIMFTVLFRMGFNVPPAVVGNVVAGSPAQEAGIQVGDRVLWFNGDFQHDFNKIMMNVALVEEGQNVPIRLRGIDGQERDLNITARREEGDLAGFLRLGIEPGYELRGLDSSKLDKSWEDARGDVISDSLAVKPDEQIVAINGQQVQLTEFYKLDQALQESYGKPVTLTVRTPSGQTREEKIQPRFADPFGPQQVNFAGMVPRASIMVVQKASSAAGKLKPGDDVVSITIKPNNDPYEHPSPRELREKLGVASKNGGTVNMVVMREGQRHEVNDLTLQTKLDNGGKGLGIGPGYDADNAIVGTIIPGSPADKAKLPSGARIISVDGKPVTNWYEVHQVLKQINATRPVPVVAAIDADEKTFNLDLTAADLKSATSIRYISWLELHGLIEPRQTNKPLVAASWGATETRDLIVQFYITIRRMIQGSIAPSNAMGPIGIFHQGSRIASRGTDWVIWFLAMISANLAVVNFLPIPIVDGGLFLFLIVEKLMGKPLSPKAQGIAQMVGLALIGCVFLFVTYHDITRLF